MTPPDESRGRAPWIALVAIAALIAGLAAAWWQWRPHPRPAPAPEVNLDPAAGMIHQALGEDSTAIKQRWVEEVPGFDLAGLDSARREIFVRFANAERCTCGCGYTLAACRAYDSTCEVSAPRVRTLFDSVQAGRITRVGAGIRRRPG
ncbi:MAG TPA: hypothetical protein VGK89_07980 [Candidatus Eisenbacteria bacterium]|jgi:hypothetical protein